MPQNNSGNIEISTRYGDLKVRYPNSSPNSNSIFPNRTLINGEFKTSLQPKFVFFQFYGEFKRCLEKKWILDQQPRKIEPNKIEVPFYSSWPCNKWSDGPVYDLCTAGAIVFYTFLACVNKQGQSDPKKWKYNVFYIIICRNRTYIICKFSLEML